jgi:hypothetical protein
MSLHKEVAMAELNEQVQAYKAKVDARVQQVKESQSLDMTYDVKIADKMVQFNLPKRILEQKRLLTIWNNWQVMPDDPDTEEKYYRTVAPLIYVNGVKLDIDTTDLEMAVVDTIVVAYGDFMLRPFSVRATMKTNDHLSSM